MRLRDGYRWLGLVLIVVATGASTGCTLLPTPPPPTAGPGSLGGVTAQTPPTPVSPLSPTSPASPTTPTSQVGQEPLSTPVDTSFMPPAGAIAPFPHPDGEIVAASAIPGVDPDAGIDGIQFGVVGDSGNVAHAAVLLHGDGPSYYLRSVLGTPSRPTEDRRRIESSLGPGVGMVFAFPRSSDRIWPGFGYDGKNGASLLAIFQYMMEKTGNRNLNCHLGGLSGASLPLNSFLALINGKRGPDAAVAAFVGNNLRTITDHDALCRPIAMQKQGYIEAATRFTHVRFNFIHGHGGYMTYVRGHHEEVGRKVSGDASFELPYHCPDTISLLGGRLRFWSGPSHFECFKGQIHRSIFGS